MKNNYQFESILKMKIGEVNCGIANWGTFLKKQQKYSIINLKHL